MEIKYQVFEAENLFVQKYNGVFSIEKHIGYTRYITQYIASKPIKKVLIDFRDLKIGNFTDEVPDDFSAVLERITELRKNINRKELGNREVLLVFWVDKPLPTVIAHMFTDSFSNQNYFYCSTVESVMNILMLPEHLYPLKKLMENLENTFTNNPGQSGQPAPA
jgi:hypothetical protein